MSLAGPEAHTTLQQADPEGSIFLPNHGEIVTEENSGPHDDTLSFEELEKLFLTGEGDAEQLVLRMAAQHPDGVSRLIDRLGYKLLSHRGDVAPSPGEGYIARIDELYSAIESTLARVVLRKIL